MKVFCEVLCVLSFLIPFGCLLKMHSRRGEAERSLKRILFFGSLTALSYFYVLIARDLHKAHIGYSLKNLLFIWLLFFIFEYSSKINGVYKRCKLIVFGAFTLVILDSIMLTVNIFIPYAYETIFDIYREEVFFLVRYLPPYFVHIVLCYSLDLMIVSVFCYAYVKMSKVYWQKYGPIVKAYLLVVYINTLCYALKLFMDYSILCYGLIAYHIYFIHFTPSRYLSKMKTKITDSYPDGIVAFDNKDALILFNKKGAELFSLSEDMADNPSLEEFLKTNSIPPVLRQNEDYSFYCSLERDGKKRHFYVSYAHIADRRDKYIGSYFVFKDETAQREMLGQQRFLARYDHLTGIPNRAFFIEKTERLINEDLETEFLFIQFDIDNFRIINQLYGSRAGNALLQEIAEFLKKYIKTGTYSRLEADRFAVCAPKKDINLTDLSDGVSKCAEKIGLNLQIRASFGVFRIDDRTIPVEQMCDMAATAAQSIKGHYWERFAYYDKNMHYHLLQEQEIVGEMENALLSKQFETFFQPQYNCATSKIVGAEALVRWKHPEKGYISPNHFIPIFERNGFIVQLDQYIWESVCMNLSRWAKEDNALKDISVSVNISRIDFCRMDICKVLTELIEKYEISPSRLRLEVTESAYMENPEQMIGVIKELQSKGFIIEMDDFGSGYSSLHILKSVPVNVLKLDMNFLANGGDYERGCNILRSIISMAESIDLPIIAEGVETQEQADQLSSIGCDIIQGYYYSIPLPVNEFERVVKESENTSVKDVFKQLNLFSE